MKTEPSAAGHDIAGRLNFMALDEAAKTNLKALKPILQKELGPALDRLYATVRQTPETNAFFSSDEHINRAKNAQLGHWSNIVDANFNAEYGARVRTVGQVHARIGLEPRWYIGGYALIAEHLIGAVVKAHWPKGGVFSRQTTSADEMAAMLASLIKGVFLDMDLSISVYMDVSDVTKQRAVQEEVLGGERALVSRAFGAALKQISDGDLTARITSDLPEAYGELREISITPSASWRGSSAGSVPAPARYISMPRKSRRLPTISPGAPSGRRPISRKPRRRSNR